MEPEQPIERLTVVGGEMEEPVDRVARHQKVNYINQILQNYLVKARPTQSWMMMREVTIHIVLLEVGV